MKVLNKYNITWTIIAVLSLMALYFLTFSGIVNPYYEITLVNIFINIILAVGLNLVVGYAGQLSLGHAGFMAIGAYATGIMTRQQVSWPMLFLSILVGMILAGIVAVIVGVPTLRLRGDYLAVATLGFSEIIRILILNMDGITNGAAGLSGIPFYTGWDFAFIAAILTVVLVTNFTRGSIGRSTLAIRHDEMAAESLGINTFYYKLLAFVIGAVTAAVAGSIHASFFGVINPGQFTFNKSVDILIIVVFGGIGSVTGSIIAAIALGILNMFLQQFGALRMIIYSVVLILVMIFKPTGLLGTKEFSIKRFFSNKKKEVD